MSGYGAWVLVPASDVSRVAMDSPRIRYASREGVTPEAEVSALASVYRIVLNSRKANAAVTSPGGDDAKERSLNDSSAAKIILE